MYKRQDIDYATSEALTTYGLIGVKVWVFKGEILNRQEQAALSQDAVADERRPRRTARPGEPADRPSRPVRGQEDAAKADGAAAEAKAPVKRVRKAGTTDAAAS